MSSMMSVRKGVRKGVRNADTSTDAVGIESAGESLQLAYELHAQPRGLLISVSSDAERRGFYIFALWTPAG